MDTRKRYPATCMVHWPTGPVPCCHKHANGLLALAGMLGSHVVSTVIEDGPECTNCLNENGIELPVKK